MSKELTTASTDKGGQELVQLNTGANFFEQYGQSVSQRSLVGRLLKFNKGDWLAGEDDEEVEVGTQLVANMDQMLVGWVKWMDNKPEQQLMGLIVDGFQPAKRKDLGDDDEAEWEVGTDGKSRDPWQFTNYLLLKPPGEENVDENLFTFATSSRGGLNALGELCKAYGREMRTNPGKYPVIELGVDAYNHPNKEFGRIKVPVMKIVSWVPKEEFAKVEAEEGDEVEVPAAKSNPKAAKAAAKAPPQKVAPAKGGKKR